MRNDLTPIANEQARSILRALQSAVDLIAPGFGSLFGEAIDRVIPDLRQQRLERFLLTVAGRLERLEGKAASQASDLAPLSRRFSPSHSLSSEWTEDRLGLLEEGISRSLRSPSAEQIARFATIVASGLAKDRDSKVDKELLALKVMGDLGDVEFGILHKLARRLRLNSGFSEIEEKELHELLFPPSGDARDAVKLALTRLVALGLVRQDSSPPSGSIDASRVYLTPSGELLLKAGDVPLPEVFVGTGN